jgi:hypothetical protein
MYAKGKLQIVTPPCDTADETGLCDYEGVHHHSVYDSSVRDDDPRRDRRAPAVFLPHSCSEWVIGGKAEIQALIEDLQAALAGMEP